MRNAARFALSEGWRNAWSGRGASISMILVIAATFAAISISDALVVGQLVADEAGWVAAGGRVLGVCAYDETLEKAQKTAYALADRVQWADKYLRRDIGYRQLARDKAAK